MKKVKISGHTNKGHYSSAIISGGMVYISGLLSVDPETKKIPEGGIEAEIRVCFENLDRVLSAAGITRNQMVQCRVYLSDMSRWELLNQMYSEYFGDHKPARIVVPTPPLHYGAFMEIEGIAELEEE